MTMLSKRTFKSQHSPDAHVALALNLHVSAEQQGLSQNSFGPQSHCSSPSKTPFPQELNFDNFGFSFKHV